MARRSFWVPACPHPRNRHAVGDADIGLIYPVKKQKELYHEIYLLKEIALKKKEVPERDQEGHNYYRP